MPHQLLLSDSPALLDPLPPEVAEGFVRLGLGLGVVWEAFGGWGRSLATPFQLCFTVTD